jgi:excisionase family DNA binding protein
VRRTVCPDAQDVLSADKAADNTPSIGGVRRPVSAAIESEKLSGRLVSVQEILRYFETDRYVDKTDAAQYLGVSVRTFESWIHQIPKYRPTGKLLFKRSELDEFMKQHKLEPTEALDLSRLTDDVLKKVIG